MISNTNNLCEDWGWFIDIESNNSNILTQPCKFVIKSNIHFNKLQTIQEDEYDYSKSDKYNSAHDLFLFMISLYCLSCFPTEYELSLLMKSTSPTTKLIVEGNYIYEYLNKKYKILSRDDFIKRQIIFRIYYDDISSINIARDSKNGYIDFKTTTLFTYDNLLKLIDNDLPKPIVEIPSIEMPITHDDIELSLSILPVTEMSIFLKTIEDVSDFTDYIPSDTLTDTSSNTLCSCEFVELKQSCKHLIQLHENIDKLKKIKSIDLIVD